MLFFVLGLIAALTKSDLKFPEPLYVGMTIYLLVAIGMNTTPMKLVTIVCEAYALEAVKKLLRDVGARGWTHFAVEGAGAGGERGGEIKEFANVQIEVVLQPAAAQALLERLDRELFPHYCMIAFEGDVAVIRSPKRNSLPEGHGGTGTFTPGRAAAAGRRCPPGRLFSRAPRRRCHRHWH